MEETTSSTSKVTLKLLVDKKGNRVLFAEAGKEFVDFLFTLFSFPLGTVVRLLSKNEMVGCLGNLYQSIEDLSDAFIQPSQSKDTVLNPRSPFEFVGNTLLLTDDNTSGKAAAAERKLYMCSSNSQNHRTVSDSPDAICPMCSYILRNGPFTGTVVNPTMNLEATFVETAGATSSSTTTTVVNDNNTSGKAAAERKLYMCYDSKNHKTVSDNPVAICPKCKSGGPFGSPSVNTTMNLEATFVETAGASSSSSTTRAVVNKKGGESGFVKGVVTYMVMDNLEVKPMSTISSITLLNKFNIQDVGSLEEMVVELGMDEGLKLLKASLQTKTVLTSVFLGVA